MIQVTHHTNGCANERATQENIDAALHVHREQSTLHRPESIRATIVIPAYNEEQALPHVLSAVLAVVDDTYEVLVVDDGSRDRTREVAASFPCRLVVHEVNRGKGAAMLTGIQQARGECVIFIDGDATYPADAIPKVVEALSHYDLVRCVRSNGRDNIPLINRIGNQFFDTIIRTVHRVEGGDVLSGLYGLKKKHLLAMRLESQRFDIETEIMVKAGAMRLHSHNIPIQYHERIGDKKLNPVRDGLSILYRVGSLAVLYNPFTIYIAPGLVLAALGAMVLLLASLNIFTTISALVLGAMMFLVGFQLLVLGCIVNIYAAEQGMMKPNHVLMLLVSRFSRFSQIGLAALLIAMSVVWSSNLFRTLSISSYVPVDSTESIVIAGALGVWGIQLLSSAFFLSLFARTLKRLSTDVLEASAPSRVVANGMQLVENEASGL